LAFTTTSGAAGVSLIGTSGVDVAEFAPSTLVPSIYIGAQADNDVVVVTADGSDIDANLGQGDDTFIANDGTVIESSTIRGNDGDDTIQVATLEAGFINGNSGDDSINVLDLVDSTVQGGEGDDVISLLDNGVGTDSLINGNKGDDEIFVDGGFDGATIRGGAGDDLLDGNVADSAGEYFGDNGDDRIIADEVGFDDTLTGGEGQDTFTARAHQTALTDPNGTTLTGFDIITDFTAGTDGDTLLLDGGTIADFAFNEVLVADVIDFTTQNGTVGYAFGRLIGNEFTVGAGSDIIIQNTQSYTAVLSGISSFNVFTENNFAV
jgi:hypothetical protein